MERLSQLITKPYFEGWADEARAAFEEIYSGSSGRYPSRANSAMAIRAPWITPDNGVPFAALIHPSNANSGAYGGMSFVLFPVPDHPPMIAMGVGTLGISPDDDVLGRPGHGRWVAAICRWLNQQEPDLAPVAWAKQDPVRTDLSTPAEIRNEFPAYRSIFDRYGREIYGFYAAKADDSKLAGLAVRAFLDLTHRERGISPLAGSRRDAEDIQAAYSGQMMPDLGMDDLKSLLQSRRYVIVEGPPGTGKSRLARLVLDEIYGGHGATIQFHPNTTYEDFVGGLAPETSKEGLGLRFSPRPGSLWSAAAQAKADPRPYLLHIDEINRADLAKVLGESIYLLEPGATEHRNVRLPYDFDEPFGRNLELPPNLHILGTMNSADRSTAILDIAIRRRFAFVKLWPQAGVVEALGSRTMREAFQRLLTIFVEYASDDTLGLMPGHSYFLDSNDETSVRSLQTNLVPLLEEYLRQGYVSGFAEELRAYLQWVEALR